jgi:hypothetical protein
MKVVLVGVFENYQDLAVSLHTLARSVGAMGKGEQFSEYKGTDGPAVLRMCVDQDSTSSESMISRLRMP